jgi:hypothetical protein
MGRDERRLDPGGRGDAAERASDARAGGESTFDESWTIPTLWRTRDIRQAQPIGARADESVAQPRPPREFWMARMANLRLGIVPIAVIAAIAFAAGAAIRYASVTTVPEPPPITDSRPMAAQPNDAAATQSVDSPVIPAEADAKPETDASPSRRPEPRVLAGTRARESAEPSSKSERVESPARRGMDRGPRVDPDTAAPAYSPRRERPARAREGRGRARRNGPSGPIVLSGDAVDRLP